MNLINRSILFIITTASMTGTSISIKQSYNILMKRDGPVHATPHINNILRKGPNGLDNTEQARLNEIGFEVEGNSISVLNYDLDQSYDTDHFRFQYTLDGNNAVENVDYVIKMGDIFEQVWSFHIDTMGFDQPPMGPDGFYEVIIENLPSFYFGYTVAQGSGSSCLSYIKMRNSYSSSQFNSLSEIENIKVTAVHEFFHSIQFDYNCYALDHGLWFMEATAVWSEDELYNGINDLYRYMPAWFSNPDRPIDDQSSHMYGTFILFQYIDEHLGGPGTIKACWENSRDLSTPNRDVTYEAVDNALSLYNSSFEDAYLKMRIANRILSTNAGIYSYSESEAYREVVESPPEELLIFNSGQIETEQGQNLSLYESLYYNIVTEAPLRIQLTELSGDLSLSSIIKYQDKEEWSVRTGSDLNIDPEMGIDYISLVLSAIDTDQFNWDYRIQLSDGFSEDYTFFPPFPNPSFGHSVSINVQVITEQLIYATIYDLMGHQIWRRSKYFYEPETETFVWNGKNDKGQRVSNGIYFIQVDGARHQSTQKIIYLKK